jgi:plasmid stabilization system protein ParE
MKIIYLPSALHDFERFRDFLLANEVSDKKTEELIRGIISRVRSLGDNPKLGFSIGAKYGLISPYRGFLSGKYLVVYEEVNLHVEIKRIYHTKEDYIHDLIE